MSVYVQRLTLRQQSPRGRREGHRMGPRQRMFFNPNERPPEHFVWSIEARSRYIVNDKLVWGEWFDYVAVGPHFFRTKEKAQSAINQLNPLTFEYRIKSKYVGYIPDEDEAWII